MKGTGWLPDPPGSDAERQRSTIVVGRLLGGVRAESANLQRAPLIQDQADSESCTTHFGALALYGLTGFHGDPWTPWWVARMADLDGQGPPFNRGVSVGGMLQALERHGFPPAAAWGPEHDRFSYEATPPALARIAGQGHRLDVVPVWGNGDGLVDAACGALAEGLPVGLVVDVDTGYRSARSGIVGPEAGPVLGQHMTTLWGYRTGADGVEFRNVNSWGFDWGVSGEAWLSAERVRRAPFMCIARVT